MPSQLRQMMRAQGRDLHAEFLALLAERPRPISIQRWSVRRVGLLLLVLLALIPAIPMAWAFAQTSVNPGIGAGVSSGNGPCSRVEELWLEAQAVTPASRIPCVKALPVGIVAAISVRNGESVLELSRASLTITIGAGDQPPRKQRGRRGDDPVRGSLRSPNEGAGADRRNGRPTLPGQRLPAAPLW